MWLTPTTNNNMCVAAAGFVLLTGRALVVAAELSDRYITARFLPDKVSGG